MSCTVGAGVDVEEVEKWLQAPGGRCERAQGLIFSFSSGRARDAPLPPPVSVDIKGCSVL